jgi:hypothetical protein
MTLSATVCCVDSYHGQDSGRRCRGDAIVYGLIYNKIFATLLLIGINHRLVDLTLHLR